MRLSSSFKTLVHRGVERVAGADENGVDVLIFVEPLLVEGDLAVGGLRLAEPADRLQAVGPQVGENVLDPPQPVGPRFDLQADQRAL